jgi:hypothetical protein
MASGRGVSPPVHVPSDVRGKKDRWADAAPLASPLLAL